MRATLPKHTDSRLDHLGRDFNFLLGRASLNEAWRIYIIHWLTQADSCPWAKALKHAGLEISNRGKRYTQDEYWENLLLVWTHYGRQPTYGEMRHPPSTIGAEAYDAKWGTWRKALLAFIQYANSDSKLSTSVASEESPTQIAKIGILSQEPLSLNKRESPENRREIPLSLRFKVMYRDRFKCVLCGSNPPANPGLILHIDHIKPWSKGGKTEIDNLRTLCVACNMGRGNRYSE